MAANPSGSEVRNLPYQRISFKKKKENDYEWGKSTIDFLINSANAISNSSINNRNGMVDWDRMLANYQLYGNIVNQIDFESTFNPLGIDVGQATDKIQPYNHSYNIINVLLGEELKRPFNVKAVLTNEDGFNARQIEKNKLLQQYVIQELQMYMNPETGEQDPALDPKKIDKYISTEYQPAKEIASNKVLKYLYRKLDIKSKKNDAFKHALISGKEFVQLDIVNGEPELNILNSLSTFYRKSPEIKYVQDGLYVGSRKRMHVGDIIQNFGRDLDKKDLEEILKTSYFSNNMDVPAKEMNYFFEHLELRYMGAPFYKNWEEGSYGKTNFTDLEVYHIYWRSERKIGFLEYTDPMTGELVMEIVDENYKINKEIGETIEWDWIPEVWEGIRIGTNIYCNIRPCRVQLRSIDNPYVVKLPIFGIVYDTMNSEPVSIMDRMKPYQYLYFVVMHKFLKLIANDRGKVMPFDVSLLGDDIPIEKALYYLNELDIYLYNGLSGGDEPGAAHRGAISGSLDRSNAQQIAQYINMLEAIEQKIAMAAGVTQPRIGATSANEAVSNAQQNLMQSSHITEPMFFQHNLLWEQVLQGLIDVAFTAYRDKIEEMNEPVKLQYILDNMSIDTLMIDSDLTLSDIGIFIMDSQKDNEIFTKLESLAQPLLQNDKADFLDLVQMFKAVSVEDLERNVEAGIKRKEQAQAQQQEQINAIEQEKIALERERLDREDMNKQLDRDTKIQVATISALGFSEDKDADMSGVPDVIEQSKLALQQQDLQFKQMTESQKMAQEKEIKDKELALKEKELNSKKEIEKLKIQQTKVQNASQEKIATQKAKLDKEMAEKKIQLERMKARKKPSK